MKKNLLLMTAILSGALSYGQCDAVATLNEDFSDFTIATSNAFPQQCWNAVGAAAQGPWLYTAEAGEPANQYAVYYTHMTGANVAGYFIAPELSTIDGAHQLSFSTNKIGQGGTIPPGNITVQVGTLSDAADMTTFVAVGSPITVTETAETHANIVIEASETQKFVAFKFVADATFNAAALDNVVWDAVPANACTAVATLDENFEAFEEDELTAKCWTVESDGPFVNIDGTDDKYVSFYSFSFANTAAYLITPELTTLDGNHELSFDTIKNTDSAPGTTTVQVGTVSDLADMTTFVAVGDAYTVAATSTTHANIVIPATENKYIAFKIIADGQHVAVDLDNVKWSAITAGAEDFAKTSFSIYPNPTADKNVTINSNIDANGTVSVYTLTGAKVFASELNTGAQTLNLSSLSAGMYIVKIASGNYSESKKLIIK